jgi:hypothetical protein
MSGSYTSLQNQYKELIIEKNFTALALLIKQNENFPPAENIVRLGFKSYLHEAAGSKVKLFYLMKLKEITSVRPDDDILKEACEIALGMNSPQILDALIKRTETSKTIFKELHAILQKVFTDYVNMGRFMDISQLIDITGVMPGEELVQNGYFLYLQEVKFISFTGLKKRTMIKPDPEMVEQIYRQYFSTYIRVKMASEEQGKMWMDRLRKLKRITKMDPPDGIEIEKPEPEMEE